MGEIFFDQNAMVSPYLQIENGTYVDEISLDQHTIRTMGSPYLQMETRG